MNTNLCGGCQRHLGPGIDRCPWCGALVQENVSDAESSGSADPSKAAPLRIDLDRLDGVMTFDGTFHRANWPAIWVSVKTTLPAEDHEEALNEAMRQWLARVQEDLGGDFFLAESGTTLLLSSLGPEAVQALLDIADRTTLALKQALRGLAWGGTLGKEPVLVFSDQDDYESYMAHYLADGGHIMSGGMCIAEAGLIHVAMLFHDGRTAERTLIHELTHSSVAMLPLPLWLNEGLAQSTARQLGPAVTSESPASITWADLSGWLPPLMWDELAERHSAYWNSETIQAFWAGVSFDIPGDASELSYSLAEVIFHLAMENPGFLDFLNAADQLDAGQTAAINHLGTDLGALAATFLGEGDWRPRREALVRVWRRNEES